MNRVIAALHTVDYQAIGLADHGKPGNYFQRQIERWSKQYKLSETESIPAMDQLIRMAPESHSSRCRRTDHHRPWRLPAR